jgi:hypothetical protein
MSWIKRIRIPLLILAAVVVVATVAWVLLGRGCGDQPSAPSTAGQRIPEGWQAAPVLKTPWLPFNENEASEYTREFPAGSKVIHVVTNKGEEIEIGILPDGTIVGPVDAEYEVIVYEKRPPLFALEARPVIGGGLSTDGLTGVAGVDVVRCWRIHAGPAVAVSYWPDDNKDDRDVEVAAVGNVGFNAWRNIDIVAFGGYGTGGKTGGAGLEIAIK